MCMRTKLTSCVLPTYDKFLDPHVLIFLIILSSGILQSNVDSFLDEISNPQVLEWQVSLCMPSYFRQVCSWLSIFAEKIFEFTALVVNPDAIEKVLRPLSISNTKLISLLLNINISSVKPKWFSFKLLHFVWNSNSSYSEIHSIILEKYSKHITNNKGDQRSPYLNPLFLQYYHTPHH